LQKQEIDKSEFERVKDDMVHYYDSRMFFLPELASMLLEDEEDVMCMMVDRFEYKRGALNIRGHVFRSSAAKSPAVVLSHGFLANSKMCRTYAKLLAKMGYAAFTFDFCGGGLMNKSDGKSEDMTLFSEKEDLLAVIAHVKTLPYVQSDHISLLGCSQGGVVSAFAAKETVVERLILCYPAVCIPDDARHGKMMFYRFDPNHIPDTLGRFPMKLGGNYARTVVGMNIYEELRGFEGPVLYLHGTEDKIVNISYARKAKDCFPSCEYHEIIGGGHMFKGKADKEACELIRRFMTITGISTTDQDKRV